METKCLNCGKEIYMSGKDKRDLNTGELHYVDKIKKYVCEWMVENQPRLYINWQ